VRWLGSNRNAIGYRSVTFLRQKLSKMERYRAAQGSNDSDSTMHALRLAKSRPSGGCSLAQRLRALVAAGLAGKLQFTALLPLCAPVRKTLIFLHFLL
jgi:hypothetical protein